MADDLKKFNSLDKKRKELLKKLDMIEEKKSTVTKEVYTKVRKDYEQRLAKTTSEMKKLEGTIKTEVENLIGKKDAVEAELKQYKLKDEEIELRYSLGEYEEDEYNKLKGEITEDATKHKGELEKLVERINYFRELLGEGKIEEPAEFEEAAEVEEPKEAEVPEVEPAVEVAEEEGIGKTTEVEKEAEILLDEILRADDEKQKTEAEEEVLEEVAEDDDTKKEAEKVQCPKCGFQNEPDSWYCEKCGAEILGAPEEG